MQLDIGHMHHHIPVPVLQYIFSWAVWVLVKLKMTCEPKDELVMFIAPKTKLSCYDIQSKQQHQQYHPIFDLDSTPCHLQ